MTIREKVSKLAVMINEAEKPVLIVGNGCRNKGLVEALNMPTFLTWASIDILDDNHPLNLRDFGITANRASNFILKEADLIIALGTRLDSHEVMGNWRTGKLVNVDIDESELHPDADLKIEMDANRLLKAINMETFPVGKGWPEWLAKCKKVKSCKQTDFQYRFIEELSNQANSNAVIITDAGQTLTWTMQSWKIKEGQRLFSAFNHSPMGYAVPASIGAAFAKPKSQIIAITGDGGLQMNLQELQTIKGYNLPIKIFVLDNNGYGMIKQTQSDWPESLEQGVACEPKMAKLSDVAKCFGFRYYEMSDNLLDSLPQALNENVPTLIRVVIKDHSKISPKLKFGDEMTDLSPKITEDEKNKIIEALK